LAVIQATTPSYSLPATLAALDGVQRVSLGAELSFLELLVTGHAQRSAR
jgi:hypothetical protein